MIQFIIGFLLFGGGVFLALDKAAVLPPNAEEAKNMILLGYGLVFTGLILTLWGYISATATKKAQD